MLTLSSYVDNMYLFREDQFNFGFVYLVDMKTIRIGLVEELGEGSAVKSGIRTSHNAVNDFVFIGFFVGNDFLPRIKMFYHLKDGLQFMFKTYNEQFIGNMNYLTEGVLGNGKLRLEGIQTFIETLSKYEKRFIEEQVSKSANPNNYRFDKRSNTDLAKFKDKTLTEVYCHINVRRLYSFNRHARL